MNGAAWIAVDWGTSNLRAWAIGADGAVLDVAASDDGMARLGPGDFEPALLRLVGPWLAEGRVTEALACGMVGARQGWTEAPYAAVPCPPLHPERFVRPAVADPRLRLHILPGLCQRTPWDVMRGEETQIAGFLAGEPDFDGVLCLPGTHSKWAHVGAGEVVSFTSFMTGEIFALLAKASVLRHSVADTGWSEPDFIEAVDETLSRPERLAARLFGLRAESLLADLAPERARARLSGLLIGAELAATRPYWLGRDVVLIGAAGLAEAYRAALAHCGLAARQVAVAGLTLAGLAAAHSALASTRSTP
ncbi:MAG TPA: 2-dehydro-3-deoxygalactonokinase [Amaricoccus sp.]|uniref:2-dehydro-3-deoxygalactonokinase n=1 Tax=Amaricoccus sp. TaxID=1872485 RepID=UPI002C255BAB|nr:2-dehydro-3-deoxygalactonokinase [Amaricoccus sp.]HMQ92889.1 2-dehydro-3-deoxygalactonokinase [Amaricoccus sp.]HMR52399.1 2-dehydro-3-deoxygalactonokinase [Amaricoccus sp.]HMR59215.1 2-dehydro-3-deoxygalactonokinase [Amaricoccus sp.]HMT99320.1 2-dehydro-3-deoxygalactonokinase [Amaricoccus sp.]